MAADQKKEEANDIPLEIVLTGIFLGLFIGWYSTSGTKSQWVRLGDVFIFGPLLIFAGCVLPKKYVLLSVILIIIGAGTMAYNAKNYMAEESK